jgi:hypothetical protein
MSELIKLDNPELSAIGESKAKQIKTTFEPMVKMLEEFEDAFNQIVLSSQKEITKEVTASAKRLRIDIGKVRIETGKLKDKQKEYIKLEDKAIMGVHNILVYAVKEKEDKLKEIEDYFENQERLRMEKLQSERVEMLTPYLEGAHERNLAIMDDDVWNAYFEIKKKEYNDRIEAEKQAEFERLQKEKEEAEAREAQRIENERLKAEAIEREKQIKAEQEKRDRAEKERLAKEEAERKAREEKERKEREAHEAELKAERERVAKIQAEEQAKREKLEAELKAKEEAEKKAIQEAELLAQSELKKGDSEKVKDLIKDLTTLKSKYTFKSKDNERMYDDVKSLIDKVVNHIEKFK